MNALSKSALSSLYAAKQLPPLLHSDGSLGFVMVDGAIDALEREQAQDIQVIFGTSKGAAAPRSGSNI